MQCFPLITLLNSVQRPFTFVCSISIMDEVPEDRVLLANIMARTNTYICDHSDVHLGVMAKIIQIKFVILDECLQNIQALSLLTSSIPSEICMS